MPRKGPVEGSFVHVELISKDTSKTKAFYKKIFRWKFEEMPEMDYATFEAPTPPGGGVREPMKGESPGFSNYILVRSIDATLKKIEKAGGKTVQPKMEIPGVGWWAAFKAPGGIVQALYQSK